MFHMKKLLMLAAIEEVKEIWKEIDLWTDYYAAMRLR